MAAVANQGTTFNLPNYLGELFRITPSETPFLAMIGGLNGGVGTTSKQFTWQNIDNNAPAQPAHLEGADPAFESRSRTEFQNVCQIFQYGLELSYTKQAATGNLGGEAIVGVQPVQDEASLQINLKLERAAKDVNYSFLLGTYAHPADNLTARKTRGIVTATTTNSVAAGATALSKDHIDQLVRTMADGGAPFRNVVMLANSFNRQRISNVYGYAPEDRNVGGLSIKRVETDFVDLGVVFERSLTASVVQLVDVSVVRPRVLTIPKKGHFFVEPLAKSGAADKWQLYGEIGLEYGPENWHGKITGTTTS